MKIITTYIATIVLLLFCISCYPKIIDASEDNSLPIFKGITANKNTVFIQNSLDDRSSKIYAVDTSNDVILYTYDFTSAKGYRVVYDVVYLPIYNNKAFLIVNGMLLELDIITGEMKKLKISYMPSFFRYFNNNLIVCDSSVGGKGLPKDYLTYDPINESLKYITVPEGLFFGDEIYSNNYLYTTLYIETEKYSEFYNYSTNQILSPTLLDNTLYWTLTCGLNNYVSADKKPDYSKNPKGDIIADIFYIESFEPPVYHKILTNHKGFAVMYENDEKLFFVHNNPLNITAYTKDKYEYVNEITLNDSYFGSECLNGYIWAVSHENDGVYKVDMDTLEYKVIK